MALNISIKHALLSKSFLKMSSFIIGYLIWSLLADSYSVTKWLTVPLCFYNTKSKTIEAPETITISLTGARSALRALEKEQIAVHIDAQELHAGDNPYTISAANLFLAPSIHLHDYKPRTLIITMKDTVQ